MRPTGKINIDIISAIRILYLLYSIKVLFSVMLNKIIPDCLDLRSSVARRHCTCTHNLLTIFFMTSNGLFIRTASIRYAELFASPASRMESSFGTMLYENDYRNCLTRCADASATSTTASVRSELMFIGQDGTFVSMVCAIP